VIGVDAIPRLTQFCRETGRRRLLLVADAHTYPALGEAVEAALRQIGCEVRTVVFRDGEVVADAHHLLRVFLAAGGTDLAFVSVGSGTITDITRFVSHRTGCSFISVPTAPSVDGYTSIGAPLIVDGIKTTANAHAPLAIFADLAALCAAPRRMIAAGFGDMLGKHTSVADWRLAHLLWDLPYDESIAARSLGAVRACEEHAGQIAAASADGVRSLMEALIESGYCMLDFGSSLPASGSEHHFSHFWEMKFLREGRPAILHGAKVGVATILVAGLYERIGRISQEQAAAMLRDSRLPEREGEMQRIRSAYGPLASDIMAAQGPFLDMSEDDYARLKQKILDHWRDIQEIARQVPGPARMTELLHAAGGPVTAVELGLTEEERVLAQTMSHYLRPHFTVTKLMRILG
ncbi:MAG: sn-glycerol-1-phosphate dehydrogenase, partial [Spirochaetia bacterium]